MEENVVKQEKQSLDFPPKSLNASRNIGVIDLSSGDSDSDVDCEDGGNAASDAKRSRVSDEEGSSKKRKSDFMAVSLPPGFLDPLPPREPLALPKPEPRPESDMEPIRMLPPKVGIPGCKQFWKAGDYEGDLVANSALSWASAGMDHVRVHPKFLHSNATSHKWALGAFAELLDNSLDEVCSGATYVNIDMLENKKDKSKMLLVEDNGGGMDPDKMRQCMSLGYSAKSKLANTIGQYGNGFKTSTMRLGADVIVFSHCHGKDRKSPTQSIGLLSYTYLRSTRKEDIVVPMLDYEKAGKVWKNMSRLSPVDWNINVETIVHWSPFSSEAELLQQFTSMEDQGTRIIIYNLWEDDQGDLELDFCADRHDIQIRGVNRDPKKIQMAQKFPNSKHFLTYRHSLRNYVSILYLRLPVGFRIILRGKDVQHHDIVNDMMLIQEITYRPQPSSNGIPKESNMVAVVTIGFVKDAKDHIDVQGFNVYHKNRLIKPFWRLWNSTGSDGRGVIGVLEANFVEPAHDKQGFERTTVLQRLESRLIQMQKTYWSNNCHRIGYAPRRIKEVLKDQTSDSHKSRTFKKKDSKHVNGHRTNGVENGSRYGSKLNSSESTSEDESDQDFPCENSLNKGSSSRKESTPQNSSHKESSYIPCSLSHSEKEHQVSEGETKTVASGTFLKSSTSNGNGATVSHSDGESLKQLEAENCELKERLKMEESELLTLQSERDRSKSLQAQIHELERKIEEARKEQEALIDIFSEERSRRDKEEAALRKKLKDAHATIQDLTQKLRLSSINIKPEP